MAERRKLRGGMLLLTMMGACLMLPPLVYVFDQPIAHFGIPQIVLYLRHCAADPCLGARRIGSRSGRE